MIASMNGHYEVVQRLVTKHGALMNLEDSEGKTAREHAIEALEQELAKKTQDLKVKKRIADLSKIKQLLPDEDKQGEVSDSETP